MRSLLQIQAVKDDSRTSAVPLFTKRPQDHESELCERLAVHSAFHVALHSQEQQLGAGLHDRESEIAVSHTAGTVRVSGPSEKSQTTHSSAAIVLNTTVAVQRRKMSRKKSR